MVPEWLKVLGGLAPFMIIISVGVVVFGVYKFIGYWAVRSHDEEEEERKRQELIRNLNQKIASGKLKH